MKGCESKDDLQTTAHEEVPNDVDHFVVRKCPQPSSGRDGDVDG